MTATYDVGDSVLLTYTLVDADGDPTAGTVACTLTLPDGTTSSPTVTNPTLGTYTTTVEVTQAGLWLWLFEATGAATDTEDGSFYAATAASANVYTTLPELKAALGIPVADTTDDEDLGDAILAASRMVDGDCQRHFFKVTEARTLGACDQWRLKLGEYMDLVSVTTLKTDAAGDGTYETTWAASDYQLLTADGTPNLHAAPETRPYRRVHAIGDHLFPLPVWTAGARGDLVEITGVWGWPQVPDRIRRATRLLAAETFKLNSAPLGVQGFADLGIIRVRDNPKYWRLLGDYQLSPVLVA